MFPVMNVKKKKNAFIKRQVTEFSLRGVKVVDIMLGINWS